MNEEHKAIRVLKNRYKKLQRRLNEEQTDAKRLTMLLELCKPHIDGVLKDIIEEEVRGMRYRYSHKEFVTIASYPNNTDKSNNTNIDRIRREESHKKYKEFVDEYERLHAACPKCGNTGHSSTYMGYIVNMSDTASYKDRNHCVCSECGDGHLKHDRVPVTK